MVEQTSVGGSCIHIEGGWGERRDSGFDRFPQPGDWVCYSGLWVAKHPFCGSLVRENCRQLSVGGGSPALGQICSWD